MLTLAWDRRPGCQVDVCKCEFGSEERNAASSSLDRGGGARERGGGEREV